MKNKCYIGLGSNLGDRLNYLKKAVEMINSDRDCRVIGQSSVYETRPYGNREQGSFFNSVIEIQTSLEPFPLLDRLKGIEIELGRKSTEKWGPRVIDLDILLFNEISIIHEKLIIPHKELLKRDFFVEPLVEIAPEIFHPVRKIRLKEVKFNRDNSYILRSFVTNFLTENV
jgi:2-amino-4-hydroxy-6-hydroxymethyldihydropteridine diphosphokinase